MSGLGIIIALSGIGFTIYIGVQCWKLMSMTNQILEAAKRKRRQKGGA